MASGSRSYDDLGSSVFRVLVVEDFEPFRRVIFSLLGKNPRVQIVGEVANGFDAVRKAEELQPDVVLLDIELPTLNGLEAARRIRKQSPNSKILFVSQESSAEVVQEAFRTGAVGYVVKTNAGSELLAAVEAALQGKRFVSRGLSGDGFAQSGNPTRKDTLLPFVPKRAAITRIHEVQFRSDDASFLRGFVHFIEAALKAGNATIVVATEPHRHSLFQILEARGLNIRAALEEGSYIPLDVADTLSTFMVNDLPDPVRFRKAAAELVKAAAKGSKGKPPRVAACGECAPILWAQGKAEAAIQVEHLWDEVAKAHDVDILCGYLMKDFQCRQESHSYEQICAEHSAVRFQ